MYSRFQISNQYWQWPTGHEWTVRMPCQWVWDTVSDNGKQAAAAAVVVLEVISHVPAIEDAIIAMHGECVMCRVIDCDDGVMWIVYGKSTGHNNVRATINHVRAYVRQRTDWPEKRLRVRRTCLRRRVEFYCNNN